MPDRRLTHEEENAIELTRRADRRGSDLRVGISSQAAPPAWPRAGVEPKWWRWRVVVAVRWAHEALFNVLEGYDGGGARQSAGARRHRFRELCVRPADKHAFVLCRAEWAGAMA